MDRQARAPGDIVLVKSREMRGRSQTLLLAVVAGGRRGKDDRKQNTVEEQIDETDIRKIPQIVWVESGSLTVPV